jgi:hypothetical protein
MRHAGQDELDRALGDEEAQARSAERLTGRACRRVVPRASDRGWVHRSNDRNASSIAANEAAAIGCIGKRDVGGALARLDVARVRIFMSEESGSRHRRAGCG